MKTALIYAALVALASAQQPSGGAAPGGGAAAAPGGGAAPGGAAPSGGGTIVTITSPLTGTAYKAGSKASITWINPRVDTIPKIVLARGPSTALQPVAQIAQNVNAATGSYQWDIPQDCENGNDYAFELGESPSLAFAGPFTIEGCSGGGFSSAAASGGSPSSAAAPAGSSSGSSSPSAASGSSSGSTPASSSTSQKGSSSSPASAEGAAGHVIPGAAAAVLGGLAAIYQLF